MSDLLSPYEQRYRRDLDRLAAGLWGNLSGLPSLSEEVAESALELLLRMACRSQHADPIRLGREGVLSIPRDWLLPRIERVANRVLDLSDDWEFRRLLELYSRLDPLPLARLVHRGLLDGNPEVAEAARDFALRGAQASRSPRAIPREKLAYTV